MQQIASGRNRPMPNRRAGDTGRRSARLGGHGGADPSPNRACDTRIAPGRSERAGKGVRPACAGLHEWNRATALVRVIDRVRGV